ncbi:hypothetical protein KY325_00460 [Candidatus Woesearchaeota archaeon]|nr:hypothetical protein [Candidatus Woesearchaeota archaeon]MBW3017616.1 hypothetical protein [Candidatus Woesearchaeota archaeon]
MDEKPESSQATATESCFRVIVNDKAYNIPYSKFVFYQILAKTQDTLVRFARRATERGANFVDYRNFMISGVANCYYCKRFEHFADFERAAKMNSGATFLQEGCRYQRPPETKVRGLVECVITDSLLEVLAEDGCLDEYHDPAYVPLPEPVQPKEEEKRSFWRRLFRRT